MTPEAPACRFRVRLTPRAAGDQVRGVDETGTLLVRVAAPPVDGAANEALVRLVARELGVARAAVTIASGATGRTKRLHVAVGADRVRERWPALEVVG